METEQLYYLNNTIKDFEASIIELYETKKGWRVILDRTAFYPEGGGQSADRGHIDGIPVLDVQKEDDVIAHYLKNKPEKNIVFCQIDWQHRFHYMQQHTGQHIISGVFWKTGKFKTTSVHMGLDYTTIEFVAPKISSEEILISETLANQIVGKNIMVKAAFPDLIELNQFELRRPCKQTHNIRLIIIENFDCVACGGVHCSTTGQVGLIKAIGQEKIRGNTRIIWKIGDSAYRDYDQKNNILTELRSMLNTDDHTIPTKINQMNEEITALKHQKNATEQRLAELLSEQLFEKRNRISERPYDFLLHTFTNEDDRLMKLVSKELISYDKVISCLINKTKNRFSWIITSSEDIDSPITGIMKKLFEKDYIKGGGRFPLWQGIGTDSEKTNEFSELVRKLLLQLKDSNGF